MAAIVLDNSALVELVLSLRCPQSLRRRVLTAAVHVPEILDAEFLSVVRRWTLGRKLDANTATTALHTVIAGPFARVPLRPLAMRAWEIRHAVDAYDALYVALAEQLGAPLVTCDARLAASNGHQADIELYPRG